MPAATVNLTIEQGSTWEESFILSTKDAQGVETVTNLTGYTARLQARATVNTPSVLLDLSTQNGGIVIDGPSGKLTLVMSATATAAIDWSPTGKYEPATGKYQVELTTPDGKVSRFIQGTITLDPEIVRDQV